MLLKEQATYIPCIGESSAYTRELVLEGDFPDTNGPPIELENGQILLDGVLSRKLQLIPGLTVSTGIVPYSIDPTSV